MTHGTTLTVIKTTLILSLWENNRLILLHTLLLSAYMLQFLFPICSVGSYNYSIQPKVSSSSCCNITQISLLMYLSCIIFSCFVFLPHFSLYCFCTIFFFSSFSFFPLFFFFFLTCLEHCLFDRIRFRGLLLHLYADSTFQQCQKKNLWLKPVLFNDKGLNKDINVPLFPTKTTRQCAWCKIAGVLLVLLYFQVTLLFVVCPSLLRLVGSRQRLWLDSSGTWQENWK